MPQMRTPIIALDYKDKHKAVPKELMIDYTTGNIYVVSAENREVIFDVTSKILKQLDSVQGDKVEITIEGVGTVKLNEYLAKVANRVNNGITAHRLTDEVSYIIKPNVMDNRSINAINNDIQVAGFREAEPGTFPVKNRSGKIEWVKLQDDAIGKGMGYANESEGSGDIIGPSNPDNGRRMDAYQNTPYNGKVFLRTSRRQVTTHPYQNLRVVLPSNILDDYSEIQWCVITDDQFAPVLEFDGSIFWDNQYDLQPSMNSHTVYTFKTWTGGQKWIASAVSYNNESFVNTVTPEYLQSRYYTKSEVDGGFYNKEYIDKNYYNKPDVDSRIQNADTDPSVSESWEENL